MLDCISSMHLAWVLSTAEMPGAAAATSITLSAMSASFLAVTVDRLVEARTIWMFAGSRWRNSCWAKVFASGDELSFSPRSCCMRRSS